jgi:hypothetical protein
MGFCAGSKSNARARLFVLSYLIGRYIWLPTSTKYGDKRDQ